MANRHQRGLPAGASGAWNAMAGMGVMLALVAGSALARQPQPQPAADPTPPAQAPAPEAAPSQLTFAPQPAQSVLSDAQRLRLARSLTRLVVLDLRANPNPGPDDFALANLLLRDVATRLAPGDPQTLRRWVEAAFAGQDERSLMDATRMLIRADPKDTVAQLRLITARLQQVQTAGERLAAYEKLLSQQGSVLDASVCSRVALDAALLAREVGDEELFATRLTQATQLDSTNKDAAALAFTFFSERVPDDRGQMELLSNLLMADPLDAAVHAQIRDLLAVHGAWEGAERFHRAASGIRRANGQETMEDRLIDYAIRVRRSGAGVVLGALNRDLSGARDEQRRIFEQASKDISAAMVSPENIRLPIPFEEVRLACALISENTDARATAVEELARTSREFYESVTDPNRRPPGLEEQEAIAQGTSAALNAALWQLLASSTPNAELLGQYNAMLEKIPQEHPQRPALAAWIALASKDPRQALTLTQQSLDAGASEAWLLAARGQAMAQTSDSRGSAAAFREAERMDPFSGLGVWAGWRADVMNPASRSPLAGVLEREARAIPSWVDGMVANPAAFQRLRAQVLAPQGTLDPAPVVITMRNLLPVPLALGQGKTIESRLLVAPRVTTSRPFPDALMPPEVVDARQRLRLMPGEDLELRYEPQDTLLGWTLESMSDQATRVGFRVLQGFLMDDTGVPSAGPGCLDIDTNLISRSALDDARMTPEELARRWQQASEARIPNLIIAARAVMLRETTMGEQGADLTPLTQTIAAIYPALAPETRLFLVAEVPLEVPAAAPIQAMILRDPDPMVQPWMILSRINDPAFEVLTTALASPDALVARVAALQKARLESGATVLSRHGMLGFVRSRAQQDEGQPGGEPTPGTP